MLARAGGRLAAGTQGKGGSSDAYYGAASGTPVAAFPPLLRLKNHPIGKLNPGRAVNLERLICEILSDLADFPGNRSIPEQGRFALGYCHQRQAFFAKADAVRVWRKLHLGSFLQDGCPAPQSVHQRARLGGFEVIGQFRIAGDQAELFELPLGGDQLKGLLAPCPIDQVGRRARRDQRL
ncbi:MAG: type I-C CRISPR-associated protein Cas8c/Csd1 [Thiocapsa sp.]|nr:type I-C CRISPR-associated protein Cas8c/Csd1 [Thiocapsa sp.]MCG6895847.1 type I-C CRISPR-associated protein Cas8c/Csd1 [Thiocapsa sp.]